MTNKTTLPDPVVLRTVMPGDYRYGHVYGYTRKQMEAYANAMVRESLEEAAMILETNAEACNADTEIILRANAEAIRALIPAENKS